MVVANAAVVTVSAQMEDEYVYSERKLRMLRGTIVIVATVLWCAGCDISHPLFDSNMDELAPWTNVPPTDSLKYVAKYSKPAMEPRFMAAATFQSQEDIARLVSAFDLKAVEAIESKWPTSFQPKGFQLDESTEMLSATHPMRGGENFTVIVINLWINHRSKVLVIEKDWKPKLDSPVPR